LNFEPFQNLLIFEDLRYRLCPFFNRPERFRGGMQRNNLNVLSKTEEQNPTPFDREWGFVLFP
jgi:hypothetical protein